MKRMKAGLVMLLAGIAAGPAMAGEPVTVEQIYGCWRRDAPSRDAAPAFMSLCFRKDLTAVGAAFGDGHGHDIGFDWWLKPRGELVIDEQSCLTGEGPLGDSMILSRCVFTGLWRRECRVLNADGSGCAKQAAP